MTLLRHHFYADNRERSCCSHHICFGSDIACGFNGAQDGKVTILNRKLQYLDDCGICVSELKQLNFGSVDSKEGTNYVCDRLLIL